MKSMTENSNGKTSFENVYSSTESDYSKTLYGYDDPKAVINNNSKNSNDDLEKNIEKQPIR